MQLLKLAFWLPLFMLTEIGPADLGTEASFAASFVAAIGTVPVVFGVGAFYAFEAGTAQFWFVLLMGCSYLLFGLLFNYVWRRQYGYGFLES